MIENSSNFRNVVTDYHLVNDYEGEISEIAMMIPDGHFSIVEDIIKSLLEEIPRVKLTIFTSKENSAFNDLRNSQYTIEIIKVDNVNSKWIQDDFIIAKKGGKNVFLTPVTGSSNPMREVSIKYQTSLWGIPYSLVGGNTLKIGDHLLVGGDSIEPRNGRVSFQGLGAFLSQLNVIPIYIGGCEEKSGFLSCQAPKFYHLDLGILVIDSSNIIVTVPGLNDPDYTYVKNQVLEPLTKTLGECAVKELNVPLLGEGLNKYYPYFTNALVETRNGNTHVYAPCYTCDGKQKQKLKDSKIQFKDLVNSITGHPPRWIKGDFCRLTAREGGSLHCMTKVIKRNV